MGEHEISILMTIILIVLGYLTVFFLYEKFFLK